MRNTLSCKRRKDLEINGLEAVWIEIVIRSKKVLIGGIYRPPNSNNDYFNLLLESIDRAHSTNTQDIVITGDFNFNMLADSNNKMKDLLQQFSLTQLIDEPTHFTEQSASLIDLIIVRNSNNVLSSGVADPFIPGLMRYHCPVLVFLKFIRPKVNSYKRKNWNYNKADFAKYRQILNEHDLVTQIREHDLETGVQIITDAIFDAAEKSIPNKIVTIRPNDHPWITCHIKSLIRKRRRIYNKFKKTNNQYFWNRFKTIRNTVINLTRKSKQDYFNKLETMLTDATLNSKLFWKTSKQILGLKKSTQIIPTLNFNNEYAETDLQKANMLNEYFSSISVVDDHNTLLPPQKTITHERLETFDISPQTVKDVFDDLDTSKACGPDLMSPRLLKEGSTILAEPYSILYTASLRLGHFPSLWKNGNVTAIHKKDDRSKPANYRPITLLCQSGKSLERCVHKELYNYLNEHKLLTPFQSGFIPGDSTTFQLLHTYHTFCEAVDRGKEVRVVFCDISKAFDRVCHKGLTHKLRDIGCSDEFLNWFSSYLSNRRQRVVINGLTSDWTLVQAGVPQGSILGPLLFLIYINDIVNELSASVRLFADDTSLYIVVENPNIAAIILNNDLDHIDAWAMQWLVDFNAAKTISQALSLKRNPPQYPTLY
ncbi:MAG: reverse transcriptase family protein, partial [Candidatus Thiodiazotropha taylori]|nr:reverse transcriptase family protein [Candidatus Thiodiazotropha taylori]